MQTISRPASRVLIVLALALSLLASVVPRPIAAATVSCASFDAWEWAQTVYESDKKSNAALDPDDNGRACESLPHGFAPVLWTSKVPSRAVEASIVSITDGDTFDVTIQGEQQAVRMYHMNAPETHNPKTGVQCGGDAATAELTMMLGYAPGGKVWLEYDQTHRDQYGRRLAYVWYQLGGQVYLINEAMVRSGFAESKTYKPDVKYRDQINAAATFAKTYQLGLWPQCGGFTVPLAQAAPTPTPAPAGINAGGQAPTQSGNCDPSYPTVCIPPPSQVGDLDCKDIPYRRFQVLPPDPHRFDSDHDGVGCESG